MRRVGVVARAAGRPEQCVRVKHEDRVQGVGTTQAGSRGLSAVRCSERGGAGPQKRWAHDLCEPLGDARGGGCLTGFMMWVKSRVPNLEEANSANPVRCNAPCSQVRKLAAAADLANKDRKDSQGICFLGKASASQQGFNPTVPRNRHRRPLRGAWDKVACALHCTALHCSGADSFYACFHVEIAACASGIVHGGCAGQIPRVCARAPGRVAGTHPGGGDGAAAGGARRLLVLHRGAAGRHQAAGRALVSTALYTICKSTRGGGRSGVAFRGLNAPQGHARWWQRCGRS